jgi:hypothetical protein
MAQALDIQAKKKEDARESADAIIDAAKAEAMRIIMSATAGSRFEASPAAPGPSAGEKAQPNVKPRRIILTLSESKDLQRGGQYFGVNGAWFLLRPGVRTNVPEGLKDVLDNAVEGYAVQNPDTLQVVEWRNKLKYPYTFHGYADELEKQEAAAQ